MQWLTTLRLALEAIIDLRNDIRDIAAFYRKAATEKWFENLNQAIRPLEQGPTTKEQKDEAAKSVADSIIKL